MQGHHGWPLKTKSSCIRLVPYHKRHFFSSSCLNNNWNLNVNGKLLNLSGKDVPFPPTIFIDLLAFEMFSRGFKRIL